MLEWLTPELDADVRAYALYVSADDGEDGYHNALVALLIHPCEPPVNPQGFLRTAVKHCIFKIWRSRHHEMGRQAAFLAGEVSHCETALRKGRLPKTHCRRGHEFTSDNIMYVGTARTCKTCEHLRRAKYKQGESHVNQTDIPSGGQSLCQQI